MTYNHARYAVGQRRAVGAGLAIGIFLMPLIFAWFLLQRGYSAIARLIAFGWLTVLLAVGISRCWVTPLRSLSSA